MEGFHSYHNSHSLLCRIPFGAVGCKETVFLRLFCSEHVTDAFIRLWQEGCGEKLVAMRFAGRQGIYFKYDAVLTSPAVPTLLWYYFIFKKGDKTFYYGNNQEQTGGIGSLYDYAPPSYQITVYDQSAKTPRWLKEGVIYQIFVDRFYHDGKMDARTAKPGAMLHLNWNDPPFYTRDSNTGEIVSFDYFGGNLAGVRAKLPYLKALGVSILYFNPIFEAASNHKYDTADYKKIDPWYGDHEEFKALCRECEAAGIHIILDGVFSHTGSDSIYFNKEGRYASCGAYQSKNSPYYSWYRFTDYPDRYESWWGIDSLPNVNELDEGYLNFMIEGENSVVKQWLDAGIKGWRLDVADELPDEFIKKLRRRMKELDDQTVLIGEVWEDASHKISYGVMRPYLGGEELDSVMNYPFREIVFNFMLGKETAQKTNAALMSLYENYPKEIFYSVMNLVGSHDVPRILTILGEAPAQNTLTASQQARYRLKAENYCKAVKRLKMVLLWQMTFPGVPAVYYGDEAGAEGYSDPFNRGTYPWGRENQELLSWYQQLIKLRNHNPVLKTGEWTTLYAQDDVYCYQRFIKNGKDAFGQVHDNSVAIVALNRSLTNSYKITLRGGQDIFYDMLKDKTVPCRGKNLELALPPLGAKLFISRPVKTPRRKASGVLLPVFCLPSKHGIGDLGAEAYYWVDFLTKAKQKLWQILPLNPPGFGESPYQALSAFAGNHLFVSLERLRQDGLLTADEIAEPPFFMAQKVEYDKVRQWKEALFYIAFKRFTPDTAYRAFVEDNKAWLYDYAFFMALKHYFGQKPWYEWDKKIAEREPAAYKKYAALLTEQIEYHEFLQYIWQGQWQALKEYANRNGIRIIGDLPLFVAHDSSDVWSHQELFQLDAEKMPTKVAGVPPDYFSATGQLWGNPIYHWEAMAKDDFQWWCARVAQLAKWVDVIRLDHFRGYQAYWQVDFGELTAEKGEWTEGPDLKLFEAVRRQVGKVSYIAENLGVITDEVEKLRQTLKLPGMSVLQFDVTADGVLFPDDPETVLYTGTHDNDTLLGWFQSLTKPYLKNFSSLKNAADEEIRHYFLRQLLRSNAKTVIFPLQDILALGNDARLNLPGSVGNNWQWRLDQRVPDGVAKRLAEITLTNHR